MDGQEGKIEIQGETTTYHDHTTDEKVKQTLQITADKMSLTHAATANQKDGTTTVDSSGILARTPGVQVVAPSTGVLVKASIAGLGFRKLKKDTTIPQSRVIF